VLKSRFTLTLACALAVLAAPAVARAELVVGAADNRPESSPEQAERFYDTMLDVGLKENRLAVTWDSQQPTLVQNQDILDEAIRLATARGIKITFSVYPARATSITSSAPARAQFAAFLAHLARTYPSVKDFIVGNEPNKANFWQPQFNPNGTGAACSSYATLLAASYDALKSVDQQITIIGLAVGARGNDNARARSNQSISPVRCIRDVGRAYRLSRRTRPLMDELSLHPYPQNFTDAIETGYRWPNAGLPNLARIKQAVWDAFKGTAQPIFAEPGAPLRTLRFRLNEVGWQVAIPPGSMQAYFGRETAVTTDDGNQAAIYGNLIPYIACDPSVRSLLFFNMVDEPDLDRWQSGILRADWTRRPSYNIVRSAIFGGSTRCNRRPVVWRHATTVVNPKVKFPDAKRRRRERETAWTFSAQAEEGAIFAAGLFPAAKAGVLPASRRAQITRALRGGRLRGASLKTGGKIVGGWARIIRMPKRRLKPGYYVFAIRLAAEMNPVRTTTLVGKAFQVGEPKAKQARKKKTKPGA
jgi:hypothetical protein